VHPELVAAVMQSAASDYMAVALARSLQGIAVALVEEETTTGRRDSVVAVHGVLRP
jgi:hypothetical protein